MSGLQEMLLGLEASKSAVVPGLNLVQTLQQQTLGDLADQVAVIVEQVLLPGGYILFAVLRLAILFG